MSHLWEEKREERAERKRDWSPAGFVLTVVASTVIGALFAEFVLGTETFGHPVKRIVHNLEDWISNLDIVLLAISSLVLLAFWFAFSRTRR